MIRTFTVNCVEGGERRNTEQPRNDGTIPEQWNNAGTPDIRGHKVRIAQELDVVDFWSWNLDVAVF